MLNGEAKHEFGALSRLRFESYDAVEFGDNHFAYDESETYAVSARFVFEVIVLPKKSEELWLVLLLNTDSWISDKDLDEAIFLIHSFDLNVAVSICEFDSILHNIEEHLRKPFLVRINESCVIKAVNIDA